MTLSFRWTAKFAGLDRAYWYHLTNVLLHCLVTALVTFIAGQVTLRHDMITINRYVSGLLFAAHPIHCEAVAGLVGRADVACTFFFLAGLFIYASADGIKYQLIMVVFKLAAFLTKEYGIMLAPVCVLYDLVVRRENKVIQFSNLNTQNKTTLVYSIEYNTVDGASNFQCRYGNVPALDGRFPGATIRQSGQSSGRFTIVDFTHSHLHLLAGNLG